MLTRHVYTVIRTFETPEGELEDEVKFFKGPIKDEPDEFLYGGTGTDEEIFVKMQKSIDGTLWVNVD